jgi:hypothetical protein
MKRFTWPMIFCLITGIAGAILSVALPGSSNSVDAKDRYNSGFSERSLSGSYASSGRAGGYLSRSVGVTTFNGRGGVERFVSINAADDDGGRKLIHVVSNGTYTVGDDGIGEIEFTNVFSSGNTSVVHYDFVISKSSRGGRGGSIQANEITGIQREPGVTASPVGEYWTRREGL